MPKLEVTIAHAIPGRIRLRLSHAPRDAAAFTGHVLGHAGLLAVDYTPRTRSLLIRFNAMDVSQEEVVLRAAAALSLEHALAPVRVQQFVNPPLGAPAAFYSALLLGSAGLARVLGMSPAFVARMDKVAAAGAAGAVLDHAWTETRERGYFDPEVLTLAYLFSAFMQGNLLRASLLTWFLAFGRHLLESPPRGVRIQLRESGCCGKGEMQYEIEVATDVEMPERMRLIGALQDLVRESVAGQNGHGANLFRGLHDVSRSHDNVVDGLGSMHHGIPMRFV